MYRPLPEGLIRVVRCIKHISLTFSELIYDSSEPTVDSVLTKMALDYQENVHSSSSNTQGTSKIHFSSEECRYYFHQERNLEFDLARWQTLSAGGVSIGEKQLQPDWTLLSITYSLSELLRNSS